MSPYGITRAMELADLLTQRGIIPALKAQTKKQALHDMLVGAIVVEDR